MGGFRKQPTGGTSWHFEKGHRVCKSMGNSELRFQMKASDPEVQSVKDLTVAVTGSNGVVTSLSYSLDKGLDEYEEIKKAENTLWPTETTIMKQQRVTGNLAHVGSEPILTRNMHDKLITQRDHDTTSSGDEAQKHFLQNWQAHGPAPICSDDDTDILQNSTALSEQSFSNAHMEMNKPREDNTQQNGLDAGVQMRLQEDENSFSWDHMEEDNGSLPAMHNANNAEDISHANFKNVHWKSDATPAAYKDNRENAGRVPPEERWGMQQLATFQSLHSEFIVGRQNINALQTSTIHDDVTLDNLRLTANLEKDKEVEPGEHGVFSDAFEKNALCAPVVREGCYEFMGMKQFPCKDNSELEKLVGLGDMLESSIVDRVLTRRTEALASRTASFNLVRTRHSSSLEDGPS
jgi:hypothetical protein